MLTLSMKTLTDIPVLEGVKVLVRADFNVPVRNGVVADMFRIKSAFQTIDFLKKKGAKIILISHLESADGGNDSLQPIADCLNKLDQPVLFIKDYKQASEIIENKLQNGSCILLENLRFFEGEKANDPKFAQQLASLADIYVNDAFSVSHREHASIVGVPKLLPGYAGAQLEKEVACLSKAFTPAHPFLFILGGAKFETKLPLLAKFAGSTANGAGNGVADTIFVGGALANDLLKQKGYEVGISLVSKKTIDLSSFVCNPKIMIPTDIVTQDGIVESVDSVKKFDKIMDCGPATMVALKAAILAAKFILWNGPLGLYEDGYKGPTIEVARLLGEATTRGAETIVGGGDTLAAIAELGNHDQFSFISTGGGAMLDFLSQGTLPGIDALEHSLTE